MDLAFFKVNHLGDTLVFLPIVQTLARTRSDIRPTLWIDERWAPLFGRDMPPSRLVAVSATEFFSAWRRPAQFAAHFRRLKAVRAAGSLLSPDQGTTAHLLARLAGGRIRTGTTDVARRFSGLTHHVPWRPGWGYGKWNWEIARVLLRAAGINDWPADPPAPDLSHLVAAREPGSRPHIVIHAGAKQRLRQWPVERFAALAERLAANADVTWVARPDIAPVELPAPVRVVPIESLAAFVATLAGATLFVGNNSGPMQLACALGIPGVVLTGPSHACWDPEWHRARWSVLRHPDLSCQPCETLAHGVTECRNRAAPLACLDYWTVERVLAECRARIDGLSAPALR